MYNIHCNDKMKMKNSTIFYCKSQLTNTNKIVIVHKKFIIIYFFKK